MNKYYTGVGSRETPKDVLDLMEKIAYKLSKKGWILRSGGAEGADSAFFQGCEKYSSTPIAEIYIPWNGFNKIIKSNINICLTDLNNRKEAETIASEIHPAWNRLTQGGKLLHTRNVYQVLGLDLKTPSKFLVCYSQPVGTKGKVSGGTNTAVELALKNKVKVFNLWYESTADRLKKFL